MFRLSLILCSVLAYSIAAPSLVAGPLTAAPSLVAGPLTAAPAPFVTAHSSQVVAKNFNAALAPVVPAFAAYSAPSAIAAPIPAATAYTAPIAAPLAAYPASYTAAAAYPAAYTAAAAYPSLAYPYLI